MENDPFKDERLKVLATEGIILSVPASTASHVEIIRGAAQKADLVDQSGKFSLRINVGNVAFQEEWDQWLGTHFAQCFGARNVPVVFEGRTDKGLSFSLQDKSQNANVRPILEEICNTAEHFATKRSGSRVL